MEIDKSTLWNILKHIKVSTHAQWGVKFKKKYKW